MYNVCVLKHVPVSAVNNHILDNNFQTEQIHQEIKQTWHTGKSLLEALIFASTNPQYDKRLFIDLPVQYMKTTSSEHVVYINCFECQSKKNNKICKH